MLSRFKENLYLNHFIDSDDDDDYMRSIQEESPPLDPSYVFTCDKSLGVLTSSLTDIEELGLFDAIETSINSFSSTTGNQIELVAVLAMVDTTFLGVPMESDSWLYRFDRESNTYYPLLVDTNILGQDLIFYYYERKWSCGIQPQADVCLTSNIIRIAKDEHIELRKFLPPDNPVFDGYSFDIDSADSFYVKRSYTNHVRRCYTRGFNWELLEEGATPQNPSDSAAVSLLPIPVDKAKLPSYKRHITLSPVEDVILQLIVYCTKTKREFRISMAAGQKYILNYQWADFEYLEFIVPKDIFFDIYWDTSPGQCPGNDFIESYCRFNTDIRMNGYNIERTYNLFPQSFPYYGSTSIYHNGSLWATPTVPIVYPNRFFDVSTPISLKYIFDFGTDLRTIRSMYFMYQDRTQFPREVIFNVTISYFKYSNQYHEDDLLTISNSMSFTNNGASADGNVVCVFDSDLDSICSNVTTIAVECTGPYDYQNVVCFYNSIENTCDNITQVTPQCSFECTSHYNEPDVGVDALSFAKLFNVTKLPDLSDAVIVSPNYEVE